MCSQHSHIVSLPRKCKRTYSCKRMCSQHSHIVSLPRKCARALTFDQLAGLLMSIIWCARAPFFIYLAGLLMSIVSMVRTCAFVHFFILFLFCRPSDVNCMVRTCAFVEGCRKQPCYGGVNDTVASFCNEHKALGHVDIRSNLRDHFGSIFLFLFFYSFVLSTSIFLILLSTSPIVYCMRSTH